MTRRNTGTLRRPALGARRRQRRPIVAAVREGRTVHDNIRKVIGWTLPITLVWRLVFTSLPMASGAFFRVGSRGLPLEVARTMVANAIVAMEIADLFGMRSVHGTSLTWRGALGAPAGLAVAVTAQLAFTYPPLLRDGRPRRRGRRLRAGAGRDAAADRRGREAPAPRAWPVDARAAWKRTGRRGI